MRSVPKQRELIDAVISHLTTETGKPIGDGETPDGVVANGAVSGSFAVVHSGNDRIMEGPMNDGQADRTHIVTVMCAGGTREQAEWMADTVTEAMINQPIPPPTGRAISLVDEDERGQTDRDDTFEVEAFYAPVAFQIYTTPA